MTSDQHLEPGTESPVRESGAAGHTDSDGAARRSVLRGALTLGAVGLGGALAGCGSSSTSATQSGDSTGAGSTGTGGDKGATTPSAAPSAVAPAGGAQVLGPATAVVVGGGVVYGTAKVVVTQPTAGAYKAFTATCTHQGCTVDNVDGGTINCACHGSKFSITDGSVVHGPATMPLAAKTVSVSGGNVSLTA